MTSVSLLLTRDKLPVDSLVKLRKVGSYESICSLTSFLYLRVQVRSFNSCPGPPQCFSCQQYGHSSAFCHPETRCVRCGGGNCEGCNQLREEPVKCANCKGTPTANYRGCTAFKKLSPCSETTPGGTHSLAKLPPNSPGAGRPSILLSPLSQAPPTAPTIGGASAFVAPIATATVATAKSQAPAGAPLFYPVVAAKPAARKSKWPEACRGQANDLAGDQRSCYCFYSAGTILPAETIAMETRLRAARTLDTQAPIADPFPQSLGNRHQSPAVLCRRPRLTCPVG